MSNEDQFQCTACKNTLPRSAFAARKQGKKKVTSQCRVCRTAIERTTRLKNPEKSRAAARKYANTERGRAYQREYGRLKRPHLRQRYGITLERFLQWSEDQDHCCAICAKRVDLLHVDHDHATGQFRGLLCKTCNVGLGYLRDSPDILRAAASYLERHVENH